MFIGLNLVQVVLTTAYRSQMLLTHRNMPSGQEVSLMDTPHPDKNWHPTPP